MEDKIILRWVNTHNLKNIDVEIPKNKIITITWVSWSWKSSLAFDTIYKEWQFRYIESLSSYLRQFFNLWSRPDIDYSMWLSPAIAIEQNKRVWNIRSTVWTLAEIDDYLRLLLAKLGDIYCYECWALLKAKNTEKIITEIKEKYLNKKVYIIEEIAHIKSHKDLLRFVRRNRKKVDNWEWFIRYLVMIHWEKELTDYWNNSDLKKWELSQVIEYFYLEEPTISEEYQEFKVYWIFDRVTVQESNISRLKEDIIKILFNNNKFWLYSFENEDKSTFFIEWFTDKNFCANCNISYPDFTTQHFSPNRAEWACPNCHWIWQTLQVDFDKIIDPFSDYMDAILPWRDSNMWQSLLDKLASKYWINIDQKWKDMPKRFREVIVQWDWELIRISLAWKFISIYYKWIEDILTQQYHKWVLTVDFQSMLHLRDCPECNWAKLRKESLSVYLYDSISKNNMNIHDLQILPIIDFIKVLQKYWKKADKPKELLDRILIPLTDRASTISWLWLWYLNMSRNIDTLSWWEIQRLRLAKQLWNKLTWIIYVLDEPTIWLDTKEIKRTIEAIKTLKDMWNTIIVVEHSEEFIKNSDRIVEIWPWAWDFWWNILFNWEYKDFLKSWTLTSKYIKWTKKVNVVFTHKPTNKYISIKKASKYNLKKIDVNIRLWSFTIITWSSWAWKTTLMYHTLFKFLSEKSKYVQSYIRLEMLKNWMSWSEIISSPHMKQKEYEHFEALALQEFYKYIDVENINWFHEIKNILYVDQSSIGKTPRSCPSTFIWVFDDIRKIFAWTEESKMFSFTPWHFSFNSSKWACSECDWYWYKKIELQFLPDTYVPCSLCHWNRYKPEILSIKWRWKNISEILNLYVTDALYFFEDVPFIYDKLLLMDEIWLGYLKLWQPAHTLSWWESQRLKLVKHLLKTYKWHTVYFLDEPTVWLHPSDIEKLLKVLRKFLDNWDTILMIEHDKNLLKFSDDIIELDNWKLVKSN